MRTTPNVAKMRMSAMGPNLATAEDLSFGEQKEAEGSSGSMVRPLRVNRERKRSAKPLAGYPASRMWPIARSQAGEDRATHAVFATYGHPGRT